MENLSCEMKTQISQGKQLTIDNVTFDRYEIEWKPNCFVETIDKVKSYLKENRKQILWAKTC